MYKGKILLVEDNPDDVFLTKRELRLSGVMNSLVIAHDGAEALDYLFGEGIYAGRDLTDTPVLILLDLRLPKIDGLEVKQRILADERTSFIPLVMLTSSEDDQDFIERFDSGANIFIGKPTDFNQLAEAVTRLNLGWFILNESYLAQDNNVEMVATFKS